MKSIRRHLVVRLVLGTTLLLGFTSAALYYYSRAFLVAEFDAALRSKALALVTLTEEHHDRIELNFADEFMPEFERTERPEYFQFWLADGSILERSRSLRAIDLPRQTGTVAHPAFWDLELPDGRAGRAVGIRFAAHRSSSSAGVAPGQEAPVGSVASLVVARERTGLNHTLAAFRIALKIFALLLLAAMAALVAVVVRRELAPLGSVAERAAAIDASSLQVRFPAEGMPEELRPICERLNDLLARLEEAFRRERRISADIAHELNTPLAELRTLAEVALRWPEDNPAAFQNTLTIVQKMESMATGLLSLARTEEGKLPIRDEPVVLADLVAEIWTPLALAAQRRQLRCAVDIPRDLVVYSDPALLRHVLSNLLHNAVEYSTKGGALRINAAARDTQFHFTVENATDDLAADDLPHLFERFWRKNAARTSSGHSGLGLTLAQTLATALGLKLTAEMPVKGLLRLVLSGSTKPSS